MIKDKIGKVEIVIQYFPTSDLRDNINTKAIQGNLFYKMRGRLMGIGEDYADEIERRDTHPNLMPSRECAVNVSAKDKSVLTKSVDIVKVLVVAKDALLNANKKTQASVAALLITRTMTQ